MRRRGDTFPVTPGSPGLASVNVDFSAYMRSVRARRREVDKIDFITKRVANRSVLDVGCAGHRVEHANVLGSRWLHGVVAATADEVSGIDVQESAVKVMVERGCDVHVADAQNFDLGRTFDVLLAGDILEHLANAGGFLDSARRHMHEDAELVVTTPNPFNIEQFIRMLLGRTAGVNPEHVAWFDPIVTYHALERHGLEITEFAWLDTDSPQFSTEPCERLRKA